MRLVALSFSLLVLVVASAAAAKTPRPSLRVTATAPLVVQGTSFKANEKVNLLVNTGKPMRIAVRTGKLGGFRIAFSYRLPKCTGISIQAFGSRGSRASFSLDMPNCAPDPG